MMKTIKESDVLLLNIPISRAAKINKMAASLVSMPPLGLLYIASALKAKKYKVSFIDLAIEQVDETTLIEILKKTQPRVVGISTYFESWSAMKALVGLIRKFDEEIVIVGGGVSANFCTKELIESINFDYISLGEGESSFVDICDSVIRNKSIKKCYGLAYKNNDEGLTIIEPRRIRNLDDLPIPDRNLLNLQKYVYPFTISTARGCPGNCIFCSSRAFWGKNVYFRSVENIIYEIEELATNLNAREFFIVDDTFTMKPKRTEAFCNQLQALEYDFIWGCESRADVVTEDLLKRMYEAGCRKIQFGLESADENVLKSIKKNVRFEQVEKATKIASEIGFDINISVIIGHAEDTRKTIEYTIEKAQDLKDKYGANVLYSINTPYPGTEQYEYARELGIEIITENFDFYSTDNAIINTKI